MQLSIVIPLYNKEKSIVRAVLSVLAQTHANFELIVVDDGSTDNSNVVLQGINDNRLRLISQDNAGECAARNRGVFECSQSIVAFLDADDSWKPDFLERVVFLIKKYPECGVYGTYYEIKNGFNVYQPSKKNYFEFGWHGILENYIQIISDYFPFNSSSVVIRKEVLGKINGFPNGVKLGGDLVTWFRLWAETKFAYINLPLSTYHIDAENRVVEMYKKPLNDYHPITTLLSLMSSNLLTLQDAQYALDFIAKKQIPVVRYYLEQGDNINARKTLETCKGTVRYARKWKKLYLYALLPRLIGQWAVKNRP